jgi:formyltetrahydrofolate-dependent phosphoribosylglycinamide formyltransferase
MRSRARIAFLLSGAGSTLANLLERIDAGDVPADVVFVLADRQDARGLDHARARNVPVAVVDRRAHATPEAFSRALEAAVRAHAPDLVVLGGFLSIFRIPPDLRGRVVNVHPSLLPAFGGKGMHGDRVHAAVLARGCRVTGCTVHVVTDEVDGGPILDQVAVPVLPGDTAATLAARVQAAERDLYPRAIREYLARL